MSEDFYRLIVEPPEIAIDLGQVLMQQARTQPLPDLATETILNSLETIIVDKSPNLTHQEVAAIVTTSNLRKTKVFEEFYTEGRQAGRAEAIAPERAFLLQLLQRKVGVYYRWQNCSR